MASASPIGPGQFSRPPIAEAILDIRLDLLNPLEIQRLSTLDGEFSSAYPNKKELFVFEGGIQFDSKEPPKALATSGRVAGYIHSSADGRQLVQVRLDGFSFHRLRPYTDWISFRTEARRLWDLYRMKIEGARITRTALRYVNRIDIPLPIGDFKEYFQTTPEIAPNLPQGLSEFFMRLVIPNIEIQAVAIITETMQKPKDSRLPFILDIDVINSEILELGDEKTWETLETLRGFKNKIFNESLTQKTKELIK